MDILIKVVGWIGNVALVLGLFWVLFGIITLLQSRKNGDKKGVDDGVEHILYGGIIGLGVKGIMSAIISALQSMTF